MGQVNVNTPGGGTTDPDSSGAGFILGIIVAIIVIAALVYFLVLAPGNGDTRRRHRRRRRGARAKRARAEGLRLISPRAASSTAPQRPGHSGRGVSVFVERNRLTLAAGEC